MPGWCLPPSLFLGAISLSRDERNDNAVIREVCEHFLFLSFVDALDGASALPPSSSVIIHLWRSHPRSPRRGTSTRIVGCHGWTIDARDAFPLAAAYVNSYVRELDVDDYRPAT